MLDAVVCSKREIADGIWSFELGRSDGDDLPDYWAGAHIDVHAGLVIRQYSLCGDPARRDRYRIAVLREPESRGGSKFMCDVLQLGHAVTISEPRNHFPLHPSAEHSILLAGGIGITPILAMTLELDVSGASFEMHYCVRSRDRAVFLDELSAAPYGDRVRLHVDDGPPQQRLDVEQTLAAAPAGTHLYVCGPAGFMGHVIDEASRCGWGADRIHREYFQAEDVAPAIGGAFDVEIESTGEVIHVPATQSVVEALEEAGIFIPTGCSEGVCGTCITPVVDGIPEHRDLVMTEAEHRENNQFTPCCSRSVTSRLVIGL